mmetsp:Transcript_73596/g.195621  ORF Transcript_73596/g.195621 Transcript_73596/m.195621 type:complete len:238 (+) Transcript_73596:187-900(+)
MAGSTLLATEIGNYLYIAEPATHLDNKPLDKPTPDSSPSPGSVRWSAQVIRRLCLQIAQRTEARRTKQSCSSSEIMSRRVTRRWPRPAPQQRHHGSRCSLGAAINRLGGELHLPLHLPSSFCEQLHRLGPPGLLPSAHEAGKGHDGKHAWKDRQPIPGVVEVPGIHLDVRQRVGQQSARSVVVARQPSHQVRPDEVPLLVGPEQVVRISDGPDSSCSRRHVLAIGLRVVHELRLGAA